MYFDIYSVSSCISALCCVVLVGVWCAMPQWRTITNYISTNQIITGTLHLITTSIYISSVCSECNFEYLSKIHHYALITTICWSLCASIFAYLRLVLQFTAKMSYEKRIPTVFTYFVCTFISAVSDGLIPLLFQYHNGPKSLQTYYFVRYFIFLLLTTVIFSIYISIIMSILSCCKKRISRRGVSHILSLIGVAVLCDSSLFILYLVRPFAKMWEMVWLDKMAILLFTQRLIFQSVFLLFRQSSRKLWKTYVWKWRNRFNNHIALL